jgi:diguanylate cyclase (GGDEF)-like protein
MNKFSNTAKNRIVVIVMLTMVLMLSLLHLTLFFATRNALEKHMIHTVQGVATATARSIENDLDRYLEFLDSGDITSPYYLEMNAYFAGIKESGALAYVYTTRIKDDGTFEFLLDGEIIGSEYWSSPGDEDSWDIGKEQVYAMGDSADTIGLVDQSEWGKLIVAYAPIRNSDGEIISLMGVDISGEYLYSYLNSIQIILIILYGILLFVVWVLIKYFSNVMIEVMFKDKLTGAYTKRYHEHIIQNGIREAMKNGQDLNLMILDLDHFKNINDKYGHSFGDKVLAEVSKTIMRTLRQGDYFVRYGGEEFIAIVKSSKGINIYDIAERIRIAVSNTGIYNDELSAEINVTISIGISTYDVKCKVAELIQRADKALYESKKERNKVSFYISEVTP